MTSTIMTNLFVKYILIENFLNNILLLVNKFLNYKIIMYHRKKLHVYISIKISIGMPKELSLFKKTCHFGVNF